MAILVKLLIIIPYAEMKEMVDTIVNDYYKDDDVYYDILFRSVEEIFNTDLKLNISNYNAIVARGFSALHLRQCFSQIPVIEFTISSYDIINSIRECTRLYHPSKIGICGIRFKLTDSKEVSKLVNVPVSVYPANDYRKLQRTIEKAIDDGCDAIIGGQSVTKLAYEFKINSVHIKTGPTTILQAIREAVNIVTLLNSEKEKTYRFKSLFNIEEMGLLYVNHIGYIQLSNPASKNLTGKPLNINTTLKKAFPELHQSFRDCLNTQEKIEDIIPVPNRETSIRICCLPVFRDSQIDGIYIRLQPYEETSALQKKRIPYRGHAICHFSELIYQSAQMKRVVDDAILMAQSTSPILITGKTGNGKSALAQSIHNEYKNKQRPFIIVDCSTVDEETLVGRLLELPIDSGLYIRSTHSLIELAEGGTLFLDNIEEMPLSIQKKLLGFIKKNNYAYRIGNDEYINVRFISSAACSFSALNSSDAFRTDLLSLLSVLRLSIPDLSNREEDVSLLFLHFLAHFMQIKYGDNFEIPDSINSETLLKLSTNSVQDIINTAEAITTVSRVPKVSMKDIETYMAEISLKVPFSGDRSSFGSSDEEMRIKEALFISKNNKGKAADLLGINRSTLWRKMAKYQIGE